MFELIREVNSVPHPWNDPVFDKSTMHKFMPQDNILLMAMIDEKGESYGHIMGCNDGMNVDILTLFVQVDRRRKGVARALLTVFLDSLKKDGQYKAFLDVRPSNNLAIGLYKELGFVKVATRLNYYSAPTEDGEVYEKIL